MKNSIEVEEILGAKRDWIYSVASCSSIVFLICIYTSNILESVQTNEILPLEMMGYMVGIEFLKVFFSIRYYPQSLTYMNTKDFDFISMLNTNGRFKLPFNITNIKKTNSIVNHHHSGLILQVIEGLKGILSFIFSIALCHILLVLFGAPFIQDWMLTLQFSIILTSWLFLPFFSIIPPGSVLTHLYYMSTWGKLNGTFFRHKWRFIFTILGAWIGASMIPLDWDVPWQKWPIPCLYSSSLAYILINFIYFVYLSFYLYKHEFKKRFSNTFNKIKSY